MDSANSRTNTTGQNPVGSRPLPQAASPQISSGQGRTGVPQAQMAQNALHTNKNTQTVPAGQNIQGTTAQGQVVQSATPQGKVAQAATPSRQKQIQPKPMSESQKQAAQQKMDQEILKSIPQKKSMGLTFFGYRPPKWANDFDYVRASKGQGKPSDAKTWQLYMIDRILKMHSD